MFRKLTMIFLLLFSFSVPVYAEPKCGDFLSFIGKKPKDLQFLNCEKTKENQIYVLKASYQVSGAQAPGVEAALVESFQMPRLRFICCGWESFSKNSGQSPWGEYESNQGDRYTISMFSQETLLDRRTDWEKINAFYITVIFPIE